MRVTLIVEVPGFDEASEVLNELTYWAVSTKIKIGLFGTKIEEAKT